MNRWLWASMALMLAPAAWADTVCAQGKIVSLRHDTGAASLVRLKTDVMGASGLYDANGDVTLRWDDSSVRWQDRVRLLQVAFLLGANVKIVTKQARCTGSADLFSLAIYAGEARVE